MKRPPGLHRLWPRAASIRMRQMDATWQLLFRFLIGDDVPKSSKKGMDEYSSICKRLATEEIHPLLFGSDLPKDIALWKL